MSPLLEELYSLTVPVPTLRRDERAIQCLPGMTSGDQWVMVTMRDAGPGVVDLVELFVPTDWRNLGLGTEGLKWVLALVDKHGYEVRSYVRPFGRNPGLSKAKLAAWYRRHGFKVRRDWSMTRSPRPQGVSYE